MSKVRNLPEVTVLQPNDVMYAIDMSEGPNAGRKVTVANLKTAVIADAGEIPYDNNNSTLVADDVKEAIDELDDKVNNHSDRHAPDGIDALPTAAPVSSDADGNNNAGNANSYSRSNHKHNIAVGNPIALSPDQANNPGTASTLSRSDHEHNVPTDAPTTTLSPSSTNAEGNGISFSRNNHEHAVATAITSDISTIQPDDAADAGNSNNYARGNHKHAIATDTPVSTGTANSEGNATSFARSNHVHNTIIASSTATATADTTTVSLTDELMVGMTLTPLAGTYMAIFSSSVLNSGNGSTRLFVSLYVGGIQIAHSEREIGISGGSNVPVHTAAVFAADGAQDVEVRWRAVAGTNTAHERSLTLIRLG